MNNGFDVVQRLELLRTLARGKDVLHLGCTNWPYTKEALDSGMLLHSDLAGVAASIYGFDFDQQGIDALNGLGFENLYRADLEKLEEVALTRSFDLIIAGEIIEHLNNPGLFLEGIKRFMSPTSQMVITTVNAYGGMRFLTYGLRGRGGKAEPVHPDHVAYYSYSTLKLLLERHRFVVDQFAFYDLGIEHRPHNSRLRNILNDVCVRIAPQWADGIIALARVDQ